MPGKTGTITLEYWEVGIPKGSIKNFSAEAKAENDSCAQFRLAELRPATKYGFRMGSALKKEGLTHTIFQYGTFATAPAPGAETPLTFTISTCQEFELRDDEANGHKIYPSMLALKPAFFIQTGDTLYYDRKPPLAKNMQLARYRWGRMYSLPFQRAFHQQIPSYWMHDDHDRLKNDCWPGQAYGDLTWDQGLQIWQEQTPQSDKPYRTFRWGKDLQIWLPEGREYRSSNNMKAHA